MAGMTIPKFATDIEEAEWLFEHQDELLTEFEQAAAEGRLGRGTVMRRAMEENSVLLDAEDVMKAHAVAARKGISYQEYVKSLIRKALEKESAA